MKQVSQSIALQDTSMLATRHGFSVLLQEMGEDAFVHTGRSLPAFFQVSVATTSQHVNPSAEVGLIRPFPSGVRYVEIVLGDLGIGLSSKLITQITPEYAPNGLDIDEL